MGAEGTWVAEMAGHLPLAQVVFSRSWDQVPRWALCSLGSLLLPLPVLFPLLELSRSLCQMNA